VGRIGSDWVEAGRGGSEWNGEVEDPVAEMPSSECMEHPLHEVTSR